MALAVMAMIGISVPVACSLLLIRRIIPSQGVHMACALPKHPDAIVPGQIDEVIRPDKNLVFPALEEGLNVTVGERTSRQIVGKGSIFVDQCSAIGTNQQVALRTACDCPDVSASDYGIHGDKANSVEPNQASEVRIHRYPSWVCNIW
jgi:hypothetical protein